jgi:integrase/recombinase XerD
MDTFNGVLPYLQTIKHLKPTSVKKYGAIYRILLEWLNGRELTQDLIEEYFSEQLERNKNTVNMYLGAWRHYINYLTYKGITHGFKPIPFYKKTKRVINVLTPEEIDLIFAVKLPPRKYRGRLTTRHDYVTMSIVRFLALTGCRVNEALSLRKKDVNLAKNECWFLETKTGVPRKGFIPSSLAERIQELTKDSKDEDFVFQSMEGGKIAPGQFYVELQRIAKISGVKKHVNPHLFRHSLATQLLQEGVDISIVARILGHANIQQTYSTYAHMSDNSLRDELIKHPTIRKDLDSQFLLKKIKEQIRKIGLQDDVRFLYKYSESANSLELLIATK